MKEKSIKLNVLMSVINTSANFIFPLITYSYVARVLHSSGTGKVAFVQSILTYFSYIAALGISGYGMRECAKVRSDKDKLSKLTQELFTINICSTVIAYILLIFTILAVPKLHTYNKLFVVMSCSILLQTIGMEWLYCALEQYAYITIRSLIFKTVSVVLTFYLVKTVDDYVIYGGLTIFTTAASNVLNFINTKKYIYRKRYKNYSYKKHIKPIMMFFMSAIIITVYSQFDTVMIGFINDDSEVGIYNAALKIKTIVISISTGITSVLIPRMSLYYYENYEKFKLLLKKSLKITLTSMLPISVFIFINAEDVLSFLCGKEFVVANKALRIMMLCTVALMLTNLFGNQVLIPKGNEKRYTKSVFIGMWINLILNSILIPKYKSEGAAFATLVTEGFNMIWMGKGCQEEMNYLKNTLCLRTYITSIFIAIILEIACLPIANSLTLFWRLVVKTIVLFVGYYGLLFIQKEEIILSGIQWIKNFIINRK